MQLKDLKILKKFITKDSVCHAYVENWFLYFTDQKFILKVVIDHVDWNFETKDFKNILGNPDFYEEGVFAWKQLANKEIYLNMEEEIQKRTKWETIESSIIDKKYTDLLKIFDKPLIKNVWIWLLCINSEFKDEIILIAWLK